MATRLIKKEDIPDWTYGDVCIKTFSYGEKLKLGGTVTSISFNGGNPTTNDKDIDISELSVMALAAGIQYVKRSDNYEFFIKPSTTLDEKKRLVFDFEYNSGQYLSNEINELNKPLSDEQKKL